MKNKKSIIIIVAVAIIALVGALLVFNKASNKDKEILKEAYENSKITDKMNGYTLDLRIYGGSINKITRVDNYQNKDYSYNLVDSGNESKYVIKDKKTYKYNDKEKKYEEGTLMYYLSPNAYMDTIKEIKEAKYEKEEKTEVNKYKVYKVTFTKESINKMLTDTDLGIKTDKDIEGNIWIDKNDRIYRVYYYIDNITVFASYFGYDSVKNIELN